MKTLAALVAEDAPLTPRLAIHTITSASQVSLMPMTAAASGTGRKEDHMIGWRRTATYFLGLNLLASTVIVIGMSLITIGRLLIVSRVTKCREMMNHMRMHGPVMAHNKSTESPERVAEWAE